MTAGPSDERHGETFDAVAEAYDRVRPTYPAELVEAACATGSVGPRARVLEVGCGTGKLTERLVEQGLVVAAVDPGPRMIELAQRRVGPEAAVEFHLGRFEEVALSEGTYEAVFSATAFHWVDPAVGWTKAARSLRHGGTLALLMYISYREASTAEHEEQVHELFQRYLRDQGTWQPLRDLPTLTAGVEERGDDVSAVWTWLGHHDLTSPDAAAFFDDVRFTSIPFAHEQTADELWAFFETTSSYHRLEPRDRERLEHEIHDLAGRLGGTLRSSELAVLVTARSTGG